jgi:hypothetical protein
MYNDNLIAVHHRTVMISGNRAVTITGGTFNQYIGKQGD